MLKRVITYTDFNGNQRTEPFYFNLSKAELAEWQLREQFSGGLEEHLSTIISSNDGGKIMDTFRMIISKAYGIKSEDGRTFAKSASISEGFLGSEAYSVLFMELIGDPQAAANFINAIVPQDLSEGAGLRDRMQSGRPQPQDHRQKAPERTVELPATQPTLSPQPQYQNQPPFPHVQPSDQGVPMQPYVEPQQNPQFLSPEQQAPQEFIQRPPHESGYQG